MENKNLLIIFVKNPRKGKVKTRLAETVGNEKAYRVYLKLLKYTLSTAEMVNAKKQIWYSDFIEGTDDTESPPSERSKRSDGFSKNSNTRFEKRLQQGQNLGERMQNAFREGFKEGYEKVVIIGSDCPDITPQIIEDGFSEMDHHDVVIGPSEDGGYYLIGLRNPQPEIFRDISWSTEQVFPETIRILKKNNIRYSLLKTLNDIDTEDDLRKSKFR